MNNTTYTLITGATGGLGKEFCNQFANLGHNLVLTARSDEKLKNLATELIALYPKIKVEFCACDLSDNASIKGLFDFCTSQNIFFDHLINVSGVDTQMPFNCYSLNKISFQSRATFEGVISITNFALLQNLGSLKVLTISSICGAMPMPFFTLYSALKGALITFFDALRYEYKNNKNFVFTVVMPGSIPTRPDIIEDIKKQGLQGKLSKKSPTFVVRSSIKALEKRKKNYVPGFYNKFIYFVNKCTPKCIKMAVVAKKFSKKKKDAFKG